MRFVDRRSPATGLAGLILTVAAAFLTSSVSADPTDIWKDSYTLQSSGGFVNPLVRVGFNPCPEPPAALLLSNAEAPTVMTPAQTSHEILFGITNGVFFQFDTPEDEFYPTIPNAPAFRIFTMNAATTGAAARRDLFDVFFDISTDSGGVPAPASWTMFQPDQDPFADGGSAIGFNFDFTSMSTATFTMRMKDLQSGQYMAFTQVPEPASLGLLGFGLVALGWSRRRRRRS